MSGEANLTVITSAEEVTDRVLELVAECVEGWFPPGQAGGMPEDEFIDRLCHNYLNAEGLEIENLDTPAVRRIMNHARRVRRVL
jgi:hypothetical protein